MKCLTGGCNMSCHVLARCIFFSLPLLISKTSATDISFTLDEVEVKVLPDLNRRSINTSIQNPAVDDSLLEKTWYSGKLDYSIYRLSSVSDGKPKPGNCGTLYPIFLNAPFPALEDGKEVDLEVCLVSFRSECEQTIGIKVRRLLGVVHYYLSPTGGTSAYCFERTVSEAAPAPNFTLPEIPSVKVDLRYIRQEMVQTPNIEFTCDFVPPSSESYYYHVYWYVNNKFFLSLGPKLYRNISQTKLTENTLLRENVSLGFNLKCGIAASVEETGLRSGQTLSDSFFAGIKVSNKTVDLKRGQKASIHFQQTVPIGCDYADFLNYVDCAIHLSSVDISQEFEQTCVNDDPLLAVQSSTHCGVQLQGQHYTECEETTGLCPKMSYDNQSMTITLINDKEYEAKSAFKLVLKTKAFHDGNRIWMDYQITTVHVNLIDDQRWARKLCWAHSDPQMLTFDGNAFPNRIIDGDFILYRHKLYQVEVQYRTRYCDLARSESCICSVIVRAGGDMWTYTFCNNVSYIGFLSCKDGILDVQYKSDKESYTVHFPTGTFMTVYLNLFTNELNLDIYSSPSDIGNTLGHCGFLNDDETDDLQDRDGHIVDNNTFIDAWRINQDESFFFVENQDPEVWKKSDNMCVCPFSNGTLENEILCSPVQTAICNITKSDNSQRNICISRRKRSIMYEQKEIQRRFFILNAQTTSIHRQKKSVSTGKGKTFEEGYKECLQFFQSQKLYDQRANLPSSKLNESLSACARDASYMDGESPWSRSHVEGWTSAVGNEIQRNKTFRTTETQAVTQYITTYCPEECNSNGFCENGICRCNDSFAGSTCFIRKSDPLIIKDIEGGGVCDVSEGDHCHECHRFEAMYLTDSFTCRIAVYKVDVNGKTELIDSFEREGEFENIFEGYCCYNMDSRRQKRSSYLTGFVTKYDISVSNDGEHYGSSKSVVVYDSTCQEFHEMSTGDVLTYLKNGFCFISGRCYKHGDRFMISSCDVCNTDEQLFQWSNDCFDNDTNGDGLNTGKGDERIDEDSQATDKTVIIIACTLSGVAVVAITIVAVMTIKRVKFRRSVSDSSPSLGSAPMNKLYGQTEPQNKYLEVEKEITPGPIYFPLDPTLRKDTVYDTVTSDN